MLYTSIGISEHFGTNEVICRAIWRHLSSLPINFQYLMTWEVDSPRNVFFGLTCNSQSLPPSLDKNTIAISFAILNSQELFSVSFLRQITLWFGNPKSLQSLQNAQRDTTNFAVNKETLGTFVPRHQGTCRIIPSKLAGLDMESRIYRSRYGI